MASFSCGRFLFQKKFVFFTMGFCAYLLFFALPRTAHGLHVVVDPGHGGSDTGAHHFDVAESHVTLEIARMLANLLRADKRFKVTTTRERDIFLSLETRTQIANQSGDVLVSIHANSSPSPHVHGKEIYFQNLLEADENALYLANRENSERLQEAPSTTSRTMKSRVDQSLAPDVAAILHDLARNHRIKLSGLLAEKIYENWGGVKSARGREIRQAPFRMVSQVHIPAVLIEVGYLSHREEAKRLNQPEEHKKIANGIYQALIEFKDYMDNPSLKSLD